jgi:3-phosphoshikimate 1-carboxyvinyltransferase
MRGSVFRGPVSGRVVAPASKSFMQRAVACAVLSKGETIIRNASLSDDGLTALRLATALGADVDILGENLSIQSGSRSPERTLNSGESGLSFRMFTPVAARLPVEVTIEASGTLCCRPVGMMGRPLEQLGVSFASNEGLPPIFIKGPLHGGKVNVDGALTSQFLSGLLISLPTCRENSEITVSNLASRPYVDMTLSVLTSFGVQWEIKEGVQTVFRCEGGQPFHCPEFTVPGDWSGASGILIAGAIAGSVTVTGLPHDALQSDQAILKVLKQVGAHVSVSGGSVTVSRNNLNSFQTDVTHCPDLMPVLTALAVQCRGESMITGTGRLRFKESDRTAVMKREFGKLGGEIEILDDGMKIKGGRLSGGRVSASGDHRAAMALAISALKAEGAVEIDGTECVDKSYPGFFEDLIKIGAKMEFQPEGE